MCSERIVASLSSRISSGGWLMPTFAAVERGLGISSLGLKFSCRLHELGHRAQEIWFRI